MLPQQLERGGPDPVQHGCPLAIQATVVTVVVVTVVVVVVVVVVEVVVEDEQTPLLQWRGEAQYPLYS